MDRSLHALVTRDVLTDTVRIDVRGSLNGESRPSLVHLITRIRGMGLACHIRVDLSSAALVESAALAGLRNVLNSVDEASVTGLSGAGVSLVLSGTADGASQGARSGGQLLVLTDEPAEAQTNPADAPLMGQGFTEYTDEELFTASDSLFALLDNPVAFGGSDLLGRYNDVGEEISRRKLLGAPGEPASERLYEAAGENQVAS
ncbi:hypothetical protein [Arthrobacter sp. HMWF013]|uniref:hypothetical protein n=1 Tax=Arthrobacter sp. HMWF013 TaxID=2056849 RepID=UPI0015E80D13|nr:hypothetical protein [Arthrobacter sp. HMWF013]